MACYDFDPHKLTREAERLLKLRGRHERLATSHAAGDKLGYLERIGKPRFACAGFLDRLHAIPFAPFPAVQLRA